MLLIINIIALDTGYTYSNFSYPLDQYAARFQPLFSRLR